MNVNCILLIYTNKVCIVSKRVHMKFAENLKSILKAQNLTQSDAAEHLEVSDNTVSNWIVGKVVPSVDTMQRIADWLGVSLKWLLFGDDDTPDLYVSVPEYDVEFSAGHGKTLFSERKPVRHVLYLRQWFVDNAINPARAVRVKIFGESMRPLLWEGDSALLNLDEINVIDGRVYAFRVDDDLFIKRLAVIPGVGLKIMSENSDYDTTVLDADKFDGRVEIFGRVRDKSGRGGL